MEHKFLRMGETVRLNLRSVVAYLIMFNGIGEKQSICIYFSGSQNNPLVLDYNEQVWQSLEAHLGCCAEITFNGGQN